MKKPLDLLSKLFRGGVTESERRNSGAVSYQSLGSGQIFSPIGSNDDNDSTSREGFSSVSDAILSELPLPKERLARYACLDTLADNSIVSSAVSLHLTNALAYDKENQRIVSLSPKDPEDKEMARLCEEINNDLLDKLVNPNLSNWANLMVKYGVAYVRPFAVNSKGIQGIDFDYYLLPHFMYELRRGGSLAGYTGDYLRESLSGTQVIAYPWEIVSLKLPNWIPDRFIPPLNRTAYQYSILDERSRDQLVETQNYGNSMIAAAWSPFIDLTQAIKALKAARNNAARIDRIIGVPTSNLNPAEAAAHTLGITQNLKRGSMALANRMISGLSLPTTMNHVLPIMGEGKNQLSIDTQQIPPDISGIEDVMMYLRQVCGAIGVDPTELGWADQMSGGLGEGGWVATSGNSAQKANLITQACAETVNRLVDIHCAFKYGKVFPEIRPYNLTFHSINTAVMNAYRSDLDSRANYAMQVQTVMDMLTQNPAMLASKTYMNFLLVKNLKIDPNVADKIITELTAHAAANQPEDDDTMFESAGSRRVDLSRFSRGELEEIVYHAIKNNG